MVRDERWESVRASIQEQYDIDEDFRWVRVEIVLDYAGMHFWQYHHLHLEEADDVLKNQEIFKFLLDKMVSAMDAEMEKTF